MSNYIVSARKYRPVNFDLVVGQYSVTNTLKNAIKTAHIAHAYLFCGPRGVGKTTCARILAKTLNCFNLSPEIEACDQCESCKSFNESRSFNIHELDAASNNSVDDIRSLIDKVRIIPQIGKYSIYIIDEVHMLSQAAFNAFLKTLEEPPDHAIFILATTEKHKIIPTILSRCQIFDFHRIRVEDIVNYLAKVAHLEEIIYEEEALNVIAIKADGAMRDALSIFDQVASFSNKNITYNEVIENLNVLDYEYYFKITQMFLNASANHALLLFNEILQRGFDGLNFLSGLSSHFRDLLVCHDADTLPLLEVSDVLKKKYRDQAVLCSNDFLFRALEITNQSELSFKSSRNQRLHVEVTLIKLSSIVSEKKNLTDEQENLLSIPLIEKQFDNKKTVKQVVEVVQKPLNVPDKPPTDPIAREPIKKYESSSNISITEALKAMSNEISEDVTEPETELIEEFNVENISLKYDSLIISWNAYANKIKDDKPRMAVTLKSVEPKIADDSRIVIELNNRSQLDDFVNTTKSDLEKYLQIDMRNFDIKIEANIIDSTETHKPKLYTSEEKFKYLSQKNPALYNFQQKLNLELE